MDTRFSSAIHVLVLIAEANAPMTSEDIADSVGTNPSYIRKIIGLLKRKDIVESHQGISGVRLKPAPEQLTLFQIYQAVHEAEFIRLFDIHQNPNNQCIVGRHIRPVLSDMFMDLESAFAHALTGKTLADCIKLIREEEELSYTEFTSSSMSGRFIKL